MITVIYTKHKKKIKTLLGNEIKGSVYTAYLGKKKPESILYANCTNDVPLYYLKAHYQPKKFTDYLV